MATFIASRRDDECGPLSPPPPIRNDRRMGKGGTTLSAQHSLASIPLPLPAIRTTVPCFDRKRPRVATTSLVLVERIVWKLVIVRRFCAGSHRRKRWISSTPSPDTTRKSNRRSTGWRRKAFRPSTSFAKPGEQSKAWPARREFTPAPRSTFLEEEVGERKRCPAIPMKSLVLYAERSTQAHQVSLSVANTKKCTRPVCEPLAARTPGHGLRRLDLSCRRVPDDRGHSQGIPARALFGRARLAWHLLH